MQLSDGQTEALLKVIDNRIIFNLIRDKPLKANILT